MSSYIYSIDGTTVDGVSRTLPAEAWVDTSIGGTRQGTYVPLTEANMNDHNWYELDESAVAGIDDERTTERVGRKFAYVYTFSQQIQDDRLIFEARQALRTSDKANLEAGSASNADIQRILADLI